MCLYCVSSFCSTNNYFHSKSLQISDQVTSILQPIEKEGSQLRVQATRRRRTLAEMMSCLVNDIHKREMKNIAAAAAAAAAAGGSCKVIPVSTTITSTTSTTASPIIVSNSYLAQKPGPYNASSEQHQTPAVCIKLLLNLFSIGIFDLYRLMSQRNLVHVLLCHIC